MDCKVILQSDCMPLEYNGSVCLVGSRDACIASIIQQSSEPEQIRRMGMITYTSMFHKDAVSLPEDLISAGHTATKVKSEGFRSRHATLPEVLFKHPKTDALVAADGAGSLTDVATGAVLYHGSWKHGMRHGNGKAAIYEHHGSDMRYMGEYDGNWLNGMRHGHGTLVEFQGSKYEGQWHCDMKHGTGTLTSIGGGVWRGHFFHNQQHGVGTFTWPVGGRCEMQHYEHGTLVSSYALTDGIPRSASAQGISGVNKVASMNTLSAVAHGSAEDDGRGSTDLTAEITAATIGFPISAFIRHPNAEILRFLRHSTVNEVSGGRSSGGSIITANVTDTVESCLTKMTENSVLSVPIFDSSADRYVAVVHLLDIFAFMLDLVAKKKSVVSPTAPTGLRESIAHQRRFAGAPISEVIAMNDHLAPVDFKPLPETAPLVYAVQVLAEGAHAVPILDASGRIVRMLTQADVIRFVATHLDELGPMGPMTVGDLGLGGHPESLVVARFADKAFDVFSAMRRKNASAAPVVDNYGIMTANLSFSDVKAIAKKGNHGALQLPIHQFFTAIEKGVEAMNPSIYVKANTMLSSIVLTLAATKIHQLYFVDDALHPVGTVRTVDILKIFVTEPDAKVIKPDAMPSS